METSKIFPTREFSRTDRLILLLTRAWRSETEKGQVRELIGRIRDWAPFCRKVAHNDVGPLVHLSLSREGLLDSLPQEVAGFLSLRHQKIRELNLRRGERTRQLFSELGKHGIPVIVLKGGLFAETIYHDPGYKRMNDLDLLFRFEDIARVRDTFEKLDLVPLALLEGGDEREPRREKTHHLPTYVSTDLTFMVSAHWNLVSPKRGLDLDLDRIWAEKTHLPDRGDTVFAMTPEDNLHHLCVHFHYYKVGPKELGDFFNLLRAFPAFNWGRFLEFMERAGSHTEVFRPLLLVETLYGPIIPERVLESARARADKFVVSDTRALAARKDILLVCRSTYSSRIEKAYLAFTFETRFFRKLGWFREFWTRLLLPPWDILFRTNACRKGEISLGRLFWVNLRRTGREVGRDFGLAIFFLLMGKSLFELLGSLRSLFVEVPGRIDEFKTRLGKTEAEIFAILEEIE